jgi:hypothetical protein
VEAALGSLFKTHPVATAVAGLGFVAVAVTIAIASGSLEVRAV